MKKNYPAPQSGFFNPRIFAGFLLCSIGAWLAMFSFASTPSSGTLDPNKTVVTYQAGPLLVANQTPAGLGQLDKGPRCNAQFPCDSYTLTVNLPAGYTAAHCNAFVKVSLSWVDTGAGQSDYDLYIFKGNPTVDGTRQADYQSASSADPEVATILPLQDGTTTYTIDIVPYQPTAETLHVRAEFFPGSGPCGAPGFGSADPTVPGNPRYLTYYAPEGSSAEPSNGEFNIGFNAGTGRIMLMNSGPVWRLTTPDRLLPAQPECCEGLWEDVDNLTTIVGLDPILWTTTPFTIPDPNNVLQTITTARTFSANSTAGTNGVYGFTDDDGNTWNNVSASPPNASSDHETIGSGPYPNLPQFLVQGNPANPTTHGNAVYYCAQTFPTGAAACQRSDTLGASYGASMVIYNPNGSGVPFPSPTPASTLFNTQCRGIHGHVHVGPDGAAYVPVRECIETGTGNSFAGLVVSTDGGVTWTEHIVPNSKTQTHGSDPSIAIGANNTLYFFYVRDETPTPQDPTQGHIHVQVSTNYGSSWSKDTDLGTSHGILNVAFPEAVAGDDNRAACGFLATDRPGDYEGPHFPGVWYLFIATTYDNGDNWTVVNATPNDPVQGKIGIWQGGGSPDNRNLLDFNEVTKDEKGRVLFGYDDGCVGDCIADPGQASYGARMRVARQSGGKSLFAAYDNQTDTTAALVPKAPCLSGTRDASGSHLEWKVPDNGGSDILYYEIWRSTSSGTEVKIADTSLRGPTTKFDDNTADPNVPHYFYIVKAKNSAATNGGVGAASNELDLHVVVVPTAPIESACLIPGLTKLVDPAGDTSVTVVGLTPTPAPPGSDLLSFQLSQPYQADGIPKLVFVLNTNNGQSPQAPYSSWYVSMQILDPTQPTGFRYKAVHMTWPGTTPVFESYTPSTSNAGTTDGRFVSAGTKKPATGSYVSPFNRVIITATLSDLGLLPGDKITGFVAGVAQSTAAGTPTALYDQMPDSLGYANSYTLPTSGTCSAPGWVSRRTHGSAGEFDVLLPDSPSAAGIECRTAGTGNSYTLIYATNRNLSAPGAVTAFQGLASVGTPTVGPNANQISIPVTTLANNPPAHANLTLNGALDTVQQAVSVSSARMDILLADTNKDGSVNAIDTSQTKSRSGLPLTTTNFRSDVNVDGSINAIDTSLVKSKSGTALPP